jgi:hypothetical protein
MVADIARFAMLLAIFFIGFLYAFHTMFRFSIPDSYGTYELTFFTLFQVSHRCSVERLLLSPRCSRPICPPL